MAKLEEAMTIDRIRRWCWHCRKFTPSRMDAYGHERCAEHDPASGERVVSRFRVEHGHGR